MEPRGKTFQASGFAPDVVTAEVQSWGALTSVLGPDREENWALSSLETFFQPADPEAPADSDARKGGVAWVATYRREED